MRNKLSIFALTLIAAVSLTIGGCETDPCKDVECGSFGTCLEGDCVCDPGYEKDVDGACNVRSAEKYAGSYEASEDCSTDSYIVTIIASSVQPNKIILTNLGNYSCPSGDLPVEALVNENTIELEAGPYCPTTSFTGYTFSGSGTLQGNTLTISYVVTYEFNGSQITDTCVATLELQ